MNLTLEQNEALTNIVKATQYRRRQGWDPEVDYGAYLAVIADLKKFCDMVDPIGKGKKEDTKAKERAITTNMSSVARMSPETGCSK